MELIKIISPGRICLFGDHQDYLGLPVIACAINKHITLEAKKRKDSKYQFIINLPDINEVRYLAHDISYTTGGSRDYFLSAIKVLREYGCTPDGNCYDVTISGNLPINAGVSSSTAVIIAWVTFLIEVFGINQKVSPELIAKLAFESEVVENREPGGSMDQYTIAIGGNIFLNTIDNSYKSLIYDDLYMILGESGIHKQTLNTLKSKKDKALKALSFIQKEMPDFTLINRSFKDYDQYKGYIPKNLRPYFFAALNNYSITKKALQEFEKEKLDGVKLGELMNEHHNVLKDILKVTVPTIDNMIAEAKSAGAYGAKIVGSGGGGCIVALAPLSEVEKVCKAIKAVGKDAYAVKVSKGVEVISS